MAKVDTIELNILGKDYTYNVNVGKEGIFRVRLDLLVAQTLGIESKIEFKTLDDLTSYIYTPYREFLEAKKEEKAIIWIDFKSSRSMCTDQKGFQLLPLHSKYVKSDFSDIPSIAFEFGLIIEVSHSTGTTTYYKAKLGRELLDWEQKRKENFDENKVYKDSQTYSVPGAKKIPFTIESYNTLIKARQGLRSISEILYNFIKQDEADIVKTLSEGNIMKLKQ